MVVEWTDSFICSICNTPKKVVKVLEEGIDPDTKNPYPKNGNGLWPYRNKTKDKQRT